MPYGYKEVLARYPLKCEETKRDIKKGEECLWEIGTGKFYKLDTKTAEQYQEKLIKEYEE